ncbi:MAG: tetratricopeptide repeat protein [Acidobacteriia bacterium]|nr:tetratricopeptide repeat protein [Terriglobia bacterium]
MKARLSKDAELQKRALADASRAAEINDQLAPVHISLAKIHLDGGKYELAMERFQRALQLDSRSAESHKGIALAYESHGKRSRRAV